MNETPKTAQLRNKMRHHHLSRVMFFSRSSYKISYTHFLRLYNELKKWPAPRWSLRATYGMPGWRAAHLWLLWTPRNGEFACKLTSVVWTLHRHRLGLKYRFPVFLLACDCSSIWLRWSLTPKVITTARCLFHFWTLTRPNVELFMSQTLIWVDLNKDRGSADVELRSRLTNQVNQINYPPNESNIYIIILIVNYLV